MGRRRRRNLKLKVKHDTMVSVLAMAFILSGVLMLLSFTNRGVWLQTIHSWLQVWFGMALLLLPFVLIAAGLVLFGTKWRWSQPHTLLGGVIIFIGGMGLLRSGEIGQAIFGNVTHLISLPGSIFFFTMVVISGILILTELSVREIAEFVWEKLKPKTKVEEEKQNESNFQPVGFKDEVSDKKGFHLPKLSLLRKKVDTTDGDGEESEFVEKKPTLIENGKVAGELISAEDSVSKKPQSLPEESLAQPDQLIWEYPPLALLSPSDGGEANRGDVKKNAQIIESTFDSFGIQARVIQQSNGPSVTQYAIQIKQGTKLSRVTALATDLALALAAPTGQIRIEAPIPGTSMVGIEVPNYSSSFVTLRKMLSSMNMKKHPSKLATALGLDVSGAEAIMDIAKMPHVLIAGATGSGKSVALNAFLCSILFRASPAEVRLILVDPKQVELTQYNDLPHLLVPVITDPKQVVSALKWAANEMENRYSRMREVGVREIDAYNELAGHVAMYKILIVIDELADIMLFAPSEVEECVTRIAQKARAVGIHLVLATQRPSVDVITGLIKANIPARIAFNVSSMMDSRVILDTPGAEKLLGKGDMLYTPPDRAKPMRVQGTWVSDGEVIALTNFIKSQGQKPQYEDEITTKYKVSAKGGIVESGEAERDELFDEVAQFVASQGKASASVIQRRFSLGYNRAARIVDQLYAAGMIGPPEGSKAREVYTAKLLEHLRNKNTSE